MSDELMNAIDDVKDAITMYGFVPSNRNAEKMANLAEELIAVIQKENQP